MNESANRTSRWFVRHWRAVAGITGMVAIVAYSSGLLGARIKPGTAPAVPGIPLFPGTKAEPVVMTNAPSHILVVGTTESEEKVNLSARIPATVNGVFVSAGTRVKKGQVLVTLDDREIRDQITASEAQLKQAETEYQRAKQLFEKAATTQQALTAAESMYASARAQADRLKVMLSYAQITSPIDGVVTDRRVEAGVLAAPGHVLLAVYDPLRMRLAVPVPVRLIDHVNLGQDVALTLDRPNRDCKGKVAEIVSEIDPASRTQMVKIRLEGMGQDVLPGTFGRLWLEGEPRETILVPETAVYRVGQLEMVQVIAGNMAMRRIVTTGPRFDGKAEVLSGLAQGDVVVLNPPREE